MKDRMEVELSAWLGGFEPAATPIGLRLRAFADLREDAARPRRRVPRLMESLSSIGSLGAVVIGATAIMLVAVVGATLQHGSGTAGGIAPLAGGSTVSPTPGEVVGFGFTPDPLAVLTLLAISAFVAWCAVQTQVQGILARLVFGKDEPAAGEALPFRRPIRRIPRTAWITGGLGLASVGWFWLILVSGKTEDPSPPWVAFLARLSLVTFVPYCAVTALRYRMNDRSSRLLLAATTATLIAEIVGAAVFTALLMGIYGVWLNDLVSLTADLGSISALALAAGLVSRRGSIPRPPGWLAAAVVGGFLLLAAALFVLESWWPSSAADWAMSAIGILSRWLESVSWAAILWIGLCAWRRGDTWGWRLLLVVAALALFDRVPGYFLGIYGTFLASAGTMDLLETIREQYFWLKVVGSDLEIFGVLVVLASGLAIRRPVLDRPVSPIPDDDSVDGAPRYNELPEAPAVEPDRSES